MIGGKVVTKHPEEASLATAELSLLGGELSNSMTGGTNSLFTAVDRGS